MKFLIDNALSIKLAAALQAEGYEATHVTQFGLGTATDTEIFQFAIAQGYIVVSADTDFGTLLALYKTQKPSVILLRLGTQMQQANEQLTLLTANLPNFEADLLAGCIVIFTPTSIRIRSLPIGGPPSS